MHTKFDLKEIGQRIVYVKSVLVSDLPTEVQDEVGDIEQLFAVHNTQGEQLALVANRKLAFHLARENDMQPVIVQ
jgi:hypothetical protein